MCSLYIWVKRYNEEGKAGLKRRVKKSCSEEEKKEIIKRISLGERYIDLAKETGFSTSTIANWYREYSSWSENQVKCYMKEDKDMPDKNKTESNETLEQ